MELARLLNVCRLCLKQQSNNVEMFSDKNLMQKIAHVLRSRIQQVEPLSSVICVACYGTIFNFAEYAESVDRNQTYLEQLLADDDGRTAGKCTHASPNHNPSVRGAAVLQTPRRDSEDEPDREEANRGALPVVVHAPKGIVEDRLIRQHLELHCEVCDKKLDTFQALGEHCRIEHGTAAVVTCCEKRFRRKDRLHTHILNHVQPDAFKCETCGQICKTQATLQSHRKQHLSVGERAYQCDSCEQRFALRSQLTNHQLSHLPSEQRKHVCSVCGKAFAFKYALARHTKLHNQNGKEFVCEICAKSYSTKAGLKHHLADHVPDLQPRVQCSVCDQTYKNRDTLRLHVRVKHKGNRAHHCEPCEKSFSSKSALAAHVKYVHVRENRYACDQCGTAFRRRVELREHATLHTGKPLYECNICGQTFNHSSNYSIHRKNKHQSAGEKLIND